MTVKYLSSVLEQEIEPFQQELASLLQNRLQEQMHVYLQTVAQWYAYIILTQTRFEFSEEQQLIKTRQEFRLRDYESLDQFLDEFNGVTYPCEEDHEQYIYDSYRQELEQLTYSWVYQQFFSFVHDSFPECGEEEWEELCQTLIDRFHADHLIMKLASELEQRVRPCNVKFLFELGKENAQKQLYEENCKRRERMMKEEKKKRIADDVWRKVEVMYYLKYTEEIPSRIDKQEYQQRLYPILCELVSNGVRKESVGLIGECYWFRFTDSVVQAISQFPTSHA